MKKIALAAVALAGLSGAAFSQEAPELAAREAYSQSATQTANVSSEVTASVKADADRSKLANPSFNIHANDNYSGR